MSQPSTDYVFMSYSRKDDAVMQRIVAFLREQGIKVWVDNEKLIPGTPVWEKEIEKAIQSASAVIVVLSPDSKDSEWVRREISLSDQFRRRVFPIMVRGDEETSISLRLINRQFVDIRDYEGVGLRALEAALSTYLEELKAQEQKAKLQAQKLAREKAKREATEKRQAREKSEAEQKAKEEAQLVADQKVETANLEEETTRTGMLRREQREQALRFKAEMDKLLQEKAELEERLKGSTAKENIETDNRSREAEEEIDRLAAQKAEHDHIAREKAETERKAKIEADHLAAQKAEDDRIAREKVETERRTREESDRLATQMMGKQKVESLTAQKVEPKKSMGNSRKFALGGVGLFIVVGLCVAGAFIIYRLRPGGSATPTYDFSPTAGPMATEAPTEAPLGIGSTMTGSDGMTLLYVPAGNFTMGSNADDALAECQKFITDCQRSWFTPEEPPHSVSLDAYWIDQTEVTNAMYAKCVSGGACKEPTDTSSNTNTSYYGNSQFDNYPAIFVDWNMANAYCSWAGRQLPSEAQWEKAARGTNGNIYPWGNTFDGTALNFCDVNCPYDTANKSFNDGHADVSPVGNYLSGQSVYGAYDMAGNVWEWVNDWYDVYPGGDKSVSTDFGQTLRVLRGGSWYGDDGYFTRSAFRGRDNPAGASGYSGFRCDRSP
jgi:formylglycine-generating enzyme required for sulfatase activity